MADSSVLITGATRGLGEALAECFADRRFLVVGVSRNPPESALWTHLQSEHRGLHVAGDVGDPKTAALAIAEASRAAELRVLVNCAGVGVFRETGAYDPDDVDRVLSSNLTGTIYFCEAAIPALKQARGVIMNVMSTAAFAARAGEAVYCAAKWGARGYTETLRQELRDSKVKVIGIYPGGMNTGFWDGSGASPDRTRFMSVSDVANTIMAQYDLGQTGYVSDLTINRL